MNWQGWVFMLIVWSFVSGLFLYSFYRVIFDEKVRYKRKKHSRGGSITIKKS